MLSFLLELKEMVAEIDVDGNGVIDFDEFRSDSRIKIGRCENIFYDETVTRTINPDLYLRLMNILDRYFVDYS